MSNAFLNAVWPLKMPMARKFVLVALADYANDSGICFPSVAAIAERCCSCVRTVQIHLQALVADGYVTRQFSAARVTTYRITEVESWPNTPHLVHPAADAPPQEMHPSGESGAPSTPQQMHPYPAADAPGTINSLNQEQELKASQREKQRGTRLPDAWEPSASVIEWLAEEFPLVRWRPVLDEFRDYWRSVPGAKGRHLDWDATFRNRIRAVAERGKHHANYSSGRKPSAVEVVENAIRQRRTREAEAPGSLSLGFGLDANG